MTLEQLLYQARRINPEIYAIDAKFSIFSDGEMFVVYEAKMPGYVIASESAEELLAELIGGTKAVA